jgi:N-acetylglutamate synthase/N-acetylornithine aminotransferase
METGASMGFRVYTANVGLKDDDADFAVIASEVAAVCAGVFTRTRFAGPSVVLSRQAVADHAARGVVVPAGNASPVDVAEFTSVLEEAALYLVRQIVKDGEGASKLIKVRVTGRVQLVPAVLVTPLGTESIEVE